MRVIVGILGLCCDVIALIFFLQAEDGIRDLVRSRGLGDVYKRQLQGASGDEQFARRARRCRRCDRSGRFVGTAPGRHLSLIHI